MAHNLLFDVAEGRHAAFYARTAAWHKLGIVVDGCLTWQDAMEKALLNWTVSKHQLSSPLTGEKIGAWGIFRDDTNGFLGAVGDQYTAIQNEYAFQFVDSLLEADQEHGAHYESAGALGAGERIWCLARVNGEIEIAGTDDKHETYLLFTTSHDGSASATCKLTTVRVVCQNTLSMALSGAGAYLRVKHTREAQTRMDAARRLMTGATAQLRDLEAKLNELAHRKVSKASFTDIMKKLYGDWEEKAADGQSVKRIENKISEVAELYRSNDKGAIPEIKGTAYNLLNAVTEYTDHYSAFRQTNGRKDMEGTQIRAENALFGTGATLKENALEVILQATANEERHEFERPRVFITRSGDEVLEERPPAPTSVLDSILDEMSVN
jgi:phage/plasmid-like protein (TIGR03299 family)